MRQEDHPAHALTLTQMSALSVIWREGPLTAGELAAKEQVKPPSITRVVSALEQSGLVTRQGNPDDGRQVLVTITDTGTAEIENLVRARELWLGQQLAQLSQRDRAVLEKATGILDRLAASD
ncbi:MarR family transcriptional regulator [Nakamurella sp. YIM 132084]|uniref:MarR family transcriptional regulator n=2 Tax=Nakamurella leprariae TaxID=2803911 RepID=A0A939BVC9_9ACTN|nr:MarR family transcriptional regulator [Nakamurella leprariae]